MRTITKRIIAVILTLAMVATGMLVIGNRVQASSFYTIKRMDSNELVVKPGETSQVKLSIKASLYIQNPTIKISGAEDIPFTFSTPVIKYGGSVISGIYDTSPVDLEFDVVVKDSAQIGSYPIKIDFTYYDYVDYAESTITLNATLKVLEEKTPTQLTIGNITLSNSSIGSKTDLSFMVLNEGEIKAKNIYLVLSYGDVIEERYTAKNIKIGDLASGEYKTITLPVTILSSATAGRKPITAKFTYKTIDGEAKTADYNFSVNLTSSTEATQLPKLDIMDIKYSGGLKGGDHFTLAIDLMNNGGAYADNIKVAIDETNVDVNGIIKDYFTEGIPTDSLDADDEEIVKIPLAVSKYATDGLKTVKILVTYTDIAGNPYTVTDTVYIDVTAVKSEDDSISKPKIIVSKYNTDVEQLKAGSSFNFTFDLYNTNPTVAAKNITVTVSQADNIFSVTQGSNSLFIEKLAPGQTVSQTLEMKVKSDASTKTYPIEILIEYEYDGAEPNPTTGEIGESKTEKLNLQAVENARPVVNNANVYSWSGPVMVGTPATLAFEFYNMGRSALNNVIAYVEGDFTKSDGGMYFIGNVTEGSSSYVEFEVIPNIEGTANGKVKITFEDSNGDTVEYFQDFTAEIMPAAVMDPGIVDGGTGEVFNPGAITAKQPILPLWAFVIMQVVIFLLFIPITRKVIISAYKSKLRRKEREQY